MYLSYEGVAANVLDYDYAPASELIENRRIYLNISQEGKSDVEFLREGAVEAPNRDQNSASKLNLNFLLKRRRRASALSRPPRRHGDASVASSTSLTWLFSAGFKPCYQISEKGLELVKRISQKEKEATHEFVMPKVLVELLSAEWDGALLSYFCVGLSSRIDDHLHGGRVVCVICVCAPVSERYGGRPILSNAHRAHESAVNTDSIRDELDEVITLNSVSIIVAEYIRLVLIKLCS